MQTKDYKTLNRLEFIDVALSFYQKCNELYNCNANDNDKINMISFGNFLLNELEKNTIIKKDSKQGIHNTIIEALDLISEPQQDNGR